MAIGDIQGLQSVLDAKYSASNVPPYPVTSVNGQTGAVTVSAGASFGTATVNLIYDSDEGKHYFTPPADMDKTKCLVMACSPYAYIFSSGGYVQRTNRVYIGVLLYDGTALTNDISNLSIFYLKG